MADMLSKDVRVAVASYDLAKQWDKALDRADDVHKALQSFLEAEAAKTTTEVAAVSLGEPPDEPELQHDVRRRHHGDFKHKPPKQSWDDYNAPNPK